jgi:hypothetical protein
MSFLDNYEDVAARIRRLHETFPENKVHTSIIEFSADKGYILVECKIYRHKDDLDPAGIDYAFGRIESYNVQMKRWFVEDTTTSAIGRCAGLVLGSETRPTKQNMEAVENMPKAFAEADLWVTATKTITEEGFATASSSIEEIKSQLGGELIAEAPQCSHGHRVWREGISAKTGKAWANYSCTEKSKATQCAPFWYVLAADGQWKPQV